MPCTYLPRMTINFNGQFPRVKRTTAKASGGQGMMPCTYLPRMTINFNRQFPRDSLGNGYSGDDVRREEVFQQNRARESLLSRPRILTEKPPVVKTGESDAAASDFPPPTVVLLSPSSLLLHPYATKIVVCCLIGDWNPRAPPLGAYPAAASGGGRREKRQCAKEDGERVSVSSRLLRIVDSGLGGETSSPRPRSS